MKSTQWRVSLFFVLATATAVPLPGCGSGTSSMGQLDLSGNSDGGAVCDPSLEGMSGCQCKAGGACDTGLVCTGGVCLPIDPGSEGGACKMGGVCNPGLNCVSDVCASCTGA